MKIYRVTSHDFGAFGPRGLTKCGAGLVIWAYTDKAQALKRYTKELKAANKEKRKTSLRLQRLHVPTMTTSEVLNAITSGEIPYEVMETIKRDQVSPTMELTV